MELLTVKDLCAALKCSRPSLYRNLLRDDFPRPIYPAPRSPRWRSDEIDAFLERITRERAVRAA